VSGKDRRVVEERDDVLIAIDRAALVAGDDGTEDAALTHRSSIEPVA
jgi:hypothetical protein